MIATVDHMPGVGERRRDGMGLATPYLVALPKKYPASVMAFGGVCSLRRATMLCAVTCLAGFFAATMPVQALQLISATWGRKTLLAPAVCGAAIGDIARVFPPDARAVVHASAVGAVAGVRTIARFDRCRINDLENQRCKK